MFKLLKIKRNKNVCIKCLKIPFGTNLKFNECSHCNDLKIMSVHDKICYDCSKEYNICRICGDALK